MKELILIRHGQADHLLQGVVGGWSHSQLTGAGREQARKTGERLKELMDGKPFNCYCSDQARAGETAAIIGAMFQKQPTLAPQLRELNNGLAADKSKDEARRLELPMTEPLLDWVPYPEGESWNMLQKRVFAFMESIREDEAETAVIVSHSNTINAIIHWWLEFPPELVAKISFDIDPCSITHLTITSWNRNKTVCRINDTSHLNAEPDTGFGD
ncbi:Putative phosphoserine phosphatase 2 [Paenibacillus konkukensis]|uniref:Phosphoserine phosphatase 2 n=1 Tax=Paenibacillus konkukensis TaxID=2020716 RepID=A0ABY4RK37_9BACL|nr:histidine phosphatase family protein [Paenibacillus konkukensis]UQZ81839.1 Putative phosphoserine phosphatase 2 [Paenibacillus konkukensis]